MACFAFVGICCFVVGFVLGCCSHFSTLSWGRCLFCWIFLFGVNLQRLGESIIGVCGVVNVVCFVGFRWLVSFDLLEYVGYVLGCCSHVSVLS